MLVRVATVGVPVLLVLLMGCDPAVDAGISVAPRPLPGRSATTDSALAIAAELAHTRGLKDFPPKYGDVPFDECFNDGQLYFCGKSVNGEAQFLFRQWRPKLSPRADSLRTELVQRLGAAFGSETVRACTWDVVAKKPDESRCKPTPVKDSAK